ncbi:hypothetical protein ACVRXS_07695 [Streptococcus orisratti]|uniref:hypothetical protein n=1 Tax=Streptococcus orisratti TaxID=114652 RepID=UPI00037105D6|nr:hypothetical protein [Streptococcus orisratti]
MNVDLTYDDGETISSQFFDDFQIDIDDIDEDTIEKAVISKSSKDMKTWLVNLG